MQAWRELKRRLGYLWRRQRFESELDEEIRFHLDTRTQELMREGASERDAKAQARREFGSAMRLSEDSRVAWQFPFLEDLLSDVRYASRALRRNPVFAGAAVLSLALGIGANLAIFSLTTEFLFSRPSVRDAGSLAYVIIGGNSNAEPAQYRFLKDAHIFDAVGGLNPETEANWRNGGDTYRVWGARITDNFFDITGIPVALGRPIHARDQREAVLSDAFWRGRLGSDPNVIGRNLIFDGLLYTVVGILPPDHRTLIGFGFSPDLYLTIDPTGPFSNTSVMLYARLRADATKQTVYPRLVAVCRQMDRAFPQPDFKWSQNVELRGVMGLDRLKILGQMPLTAFFGMLMAVVALVLLIACANVASLLLARAASRQHEFAIRHSIGASRGRIVRQLLAESLVLAALGTFAGLVLNLAISGVVNRIRLPLPVPLRLQIQPDWRLLCYAIGLAIASALICGLMPALKATKRDVQAALKFGERTVAARLSFRRVLVIAQLTGSVVLLMTAFLFLRNLILSNSLNPGFDIHHTVWAYMRLVPERYTSKDPAEARTKIDAVTRQALERLRSLPGIRSAATVGVVPMNDAVRFGGDVLTDNSTQAQHVAYTGNWISPAYFKTMQIPLLAGRDFYASDGPHAPRVLIVNQSLAQRLFGNTNPVGHVLRFHEDPPTTIVGVVKNSKYFSLGEHDLPAVFWPITQTDRAAVNLNFVLSAREPESILKEVNAALGQIDASAAIEVKPMSRALGLALLPSQVGAALLGSIGVLGLLLAVVGLYGLLTYSVTHRIREIGIRVALGAAPASVGYSVLRSSLLLVGTGLGIGGLMGYFAASPLTAFLVPELNPHDPVSLVAVLITLLIAAIAATMLPVIRALRIDPMAALRQE